MATRRAPVSAAPVCSVPAVSVCAPSSSPSCCAPAPVSERRPVKRAPKAPKASPAVATAPKASPAPKAEPPVVVPPKVFVHILSQGRDYVTFSGVKGSGTVRVTYSRTGYVRILGRDEALAIYADLKLRGWVPPGSLLAA